MKRISFAQNLGRLLRFAYPIGFSVFTIVVVTFVALPVANFWRSLPDTMTETTIGQRNVMVDVNGNVFAETWVEDRTILDDLDSISPHAVNALIATEDSRFYYNSGFDIQGTVRALVSGVGGGSGITQQLVKNLQYYDLIGNSKESATEASMERKIKELKLAMEYDNTHTKDEILLNYFNLVSFGSPNVYSIENAANYFFNKKAKDLTIAESAVLIGTVQNPSIYDLRSQEEEIKQNVNRRKEEVLNRMLTEEYINDNEYNAALNENIQFYYSKDDYGGNCSTSLYPFYCDYVLKHIMGSPRYGENVEERQALVNKGGLIIETHLDPEIIAIADAQLERDYGNSNRVVSPVAIVQPGTGAVSAIAVNREYGVGEGKTEINLPLVPMGTGSIFKLITLAAAINEGYDRNSLVFSSDCPLYTPGYDMPPGGFRNSNSCELQGGTLDYKQATAYSSNTWYVTLQKNIGTQTVKDFAASVGIPAHDGIGERSLSYTLGTTEHSTVDIAAAFATFSADGTYCPATPVKRVAYENGSVPVIPDTYDDSFDRCRSVMSPKGAGIVLEAMRANVSGEIPDAFGLQHKLGNYDSVGKSGTNELQNSTWVQSTGNYTIFTNMFDPVKSVNGIDGVYYQGRATRWYDHVSANSARDILLKVVEEKGYKSLNYGATSDTLKPMTLNQRDLFTVPSVVGAQESEAIKVFEELGMSVKIEKEKADKTPAIYPTGIIVEQSIEPGTRLSFGTEKEIILKTN